MKIKTITTFIIALLINIAIGATGIDIPKNDLPKLNPITVEEYVIFLNAVASSNNIKCHSLYDQSLESQISCFYQDGHWIYQPSIEADKDAPLNLDEEKEKCYREWIEDVAASIVKYNTDSSSFIPQERSLDERQEKNSPLMMWLFGSGSDKTPRQEQADQRRAGNRETYNNSQAAVASAQRDLQAKEEDRNSTRQSAEGRGPIASRVEAVRPYMGIGSGMATLTPNPQDDRVMAAVQVGAEVVALGEQYHAQSRLPAKEEAVKKQQEVVTQAIRERDEAAARVAADAAADAKSSSKGWFW